MYMIFSSKKTLKMFEMNMQLLIDLNPGHELNPENPVESIKTLKIK